MKKFLTVGVLALVCTVASCKSVPSEITDPFVASVSASASQALTAYLAHLTAQYGPDAARQAAIDVGAAASGVAVDAPTGATRSALAAEVEAALTPR